MENTEKSETEKNEEELKPSKARKLAKSFSKNYWAIATVILAILLIINLTGGAKSANTIKDVGPTKIGKIMLNFAKSQGVNDAELVKVEDAGSLYKVTLKINGQESPLYMTKDGKNFIPTMFSLEDLEKETNNQNNQNAQSPSVQKSDKPNVELFVMSLCPFGTQMEKGILPVLKTLKDKINFKLKFVSYAMHGKQEVDQNLVQHCIEKEEPSKLYDYLECYLEKKDESWWNQCLDKAKIDKSKIEKCTKEEDKKYKVTELFNDKSSWRGGRFPQFNVDEEDNKKYGVRGSPTLVINGKTVSSNRDSASLLKTICSAFKNPPKECDTKLSSKSPSPGFGFSTTSNPASGGCAS